MSRRICPPVVFPESEISQNKARKDRGNKYGHSTIVAFITIIRVQDVKNTSIRQYLRLTMMTPVASTTACPLGPRKPRMKSWPALESLQYHTI